MSDLALVLSISALSVSLMTFGFLVAIRLVRSDIQPRSQRPTLPGPPPVPSEFVIGEWKPL